MSYNPENALIVQSDRTILLEVHAPTAGAAREAIAPFAELIKSPEPHGVTSRLKSKSRAVFLCYPTLNNCRQPESLLRMNDNDNHLQMGGEDVANATSSPPKQGNRIKI